MENEEKKEEKKEEKSVADVLKEMQEKHDAEIKALRVELEKEKIAHAQDVSDFLTGREEAKKKAQDEKTLNAQSVERIKKTLGY